MPLAEPLTLNDAETSASAYLGQHDGRQYAFMVAHSPVYLFKDIALGADVTGLSFTFLMESPLANDTLGVYFGDDLVFAVYGSALGNGGDFSSGVIDISDHAGQSGTLTFAYYSNAAGQIAGVGDLQLYSVPEPATLSLLALGGLALLRGQRAGRRRHCQGAACVAGPSAENQYTGVTKSRRPCRNPLHGLRFKRVDR
jgi:hypothetical protein